MKRQMLTAPPDRYPRHMRHRRSYAANNCPLCLTRDLGRDKYASERYCDLDINAVRGADGGLVLLCIHWKIVRKNGFRYLLNEDGVGTRRLTRRELNSSILHHDAEWVLRLRTSRFKSAHRPMKLETALAICASYRAVANPESKPGNPGNLHVKPWADVRQRAAELGVRVVVKTLPMPGWARRCAVVDRAGLASVLIGGGKRWGPRPRWRNRLTWPTAVWGPENWRR